MPHKIASAMKEEIVRGLLNSSVSSWSRDHRDHGDTGPLFGWFPWQPPPPLLHVNKENIGVRARDIADNWTDNLRARRIELLSLSFFPRILCILIWITVRRRELGHSWRVWCYSREENKQEGNEALLLFSALCLARSHSSFDVNSA